MGDIRPASAGAGDGQRNVCFYCQGDSPIGLWFSHEFDTPVHLRCLFSRLAADPYDEELLIMASEVIDEVLDIVRFLKGSTQATNGVTDPSEYSAVGPYPPGCMASEDPPEALENIMTAFEDWIAKVSWLFGDEEARQ